jgi:hypothetical protein
MYCTKYAQIKFRTPSRVWQYLVVEDWLEVFLYCVVCSRIGLKPPELDSRISPVRCSWSSNAASCSSSQPFSKSLAFSLPANPNLVKGWSKTPDLPTSHLPSPESPKDLIGSPALVILQCFHFTSIACFHLASMHKQWLH